MRAERPGTPGQGTLCRLFDHPGVEGELKGYVRFVSEQPPYNLLDRRIENEMVPFCQEYQLGIFPWSPLAMGILAGRYADADKTPEASRAALRGGIYLLFNHVSGGTWWR